MSTEAAVGAVRQGDVLVVRVVGPWTGETASLVKQRVGAEFRSGDIKKGVLDLRAATTLNTEAEWTNLAGDLAGLPRELPFGILVPEARVDEAWRLSIALIKLGGKPRLPFCERSYVEGWAGIDPGEPVSADSVSKSVSSAIVFRECDWGDLIKGTKEQLQSLGLGLGRAYPGEPGADGRKISVQDPRGFDVDISNWGNAAGIYSAYVRFPQWWPQPPHLALRAPWEAVAPGVKKQPFSSHLDIYAGKGADLVAAGLVQAKHLPGQPGMNKVRVTVCADGSLPKGAKHSGHAAPGSRDPGARFIERTGRDSYRVNVYVSKDEEARRNENFKRETLEWQAKVRSMRRPARLLPAPAKVLAFQRNLGQARQDEGFQAFLHGIASAPQSR